MGIRIATWPTTYSERHACFVKKSLGKFKRRRDFPELVGPRILSLKGVDYFETNEYFSGRKRQESLCANLRWWGWLVGCSKLSLYVNDSCDEHAVYFRWWLKWSATFITSSSLAMINFSQIEALDFCVFIEKRTQSIQKKSKYPEQYSTVNKLLSTTSCFV